MPTWVEHAKANLKGQTIGYDPLLISHCNIMFNILKSSENKEEPLWKMWN